MENTTEKFFKALFKSQVNIKHWRWWELVAKKSKNKKEPKISQSIKKCLQPFSVEKLSSHLSSGTWCLEVFSTAKVGEGMKFEKRCDNPSSYQHSHQLSRPGSMSEGIYRSKRKKWNNFATWIADKTRKCNKFFHLPFVSSHSAPLILN